MALMLSSGRAEQESKPRLLAYNSVATVTASLHPSLACCLGDLQRSYEFHRYFEMQQQSQNTGRASQVRQKCRELNSLHTSIRSLQLHLRALLSEYEQTHTHARTHNYFDCFLNTCMLVYQDKEMITAVL